MTMQLEGIRYMLRHCEWMLTILTERIPGASPIFPGQGDARSKNGCFDDLDLCQFVQLRMSQIKEKL